MIKILPGLGIPLLLLFAWTCPAFSEPYSPSCEIAVEKVIKAQKNLIPSHRKLEIARNRERLAYADLAVCAGGGIFSARRALACNHASWKVPTRTKEVIEEEEDYIEARNEFEKFFEYAREACLSTP